MRREYRKDKEGKTIKDESGHKQLERTDVAGLSRLINRYNTSKHQMHEWASWPVIIRKLMECDRLEAESLDLTREEAKFIKNFLEKLPKEEAANEPLLAVEVETRSFVLDQLKDI